MENRRWILILGVLGIVVVMVYIAAALGMIQSADNLTLSLIFCIGPVAIVGVLEIHERLATRRATLALTTGSVFLVIAFSLFTLMLVVQQLVRLRVRELILLSTQEADKLFLRSVLKVVDLVQQGIDVSFDIFYCFGVILVSTVMYGSRDFGRIVGLFGVLSATSLLFLNLIAFPGIPGDSGLVDLGPLTAIWWLVVIFKLIRNRKKSETGSLDAT